MRCRDRVDSRGAGRNHWTLRSESSATFCARLRLKPEQFWCFLTPPSEPPSERAVTSHPSPSDPLPADIPSGGAPPRRLAGREWNSTGCSCTSHTARDTAFQSNTCDSACAPFQTTPPPPRAAFLRPSLSLPPFLVWGHSCTACHAGALPQLLHPLQPRGVDLSPKWSQQQLEDESQIPLRLEVWDSLRQDGDDPFLPVHLQRGAWGMTCDGPLVCVKDERGSCSLRHGQCHQGIPGRKKNRHTGMWVTTKSKTTDNLIWFKLTQHVRF